MLEEGIVRRRLLVPMMMLLAAGEAGAQSSPPLDQAEQVRALIERVQQLEQRVAELETKQTVAPTPVLTAENAPLPRPAAVPPPAPPVVQEHQHDMAGEKVATQQQMEAHYPSLQIRGFGDVDFSATDQKGTNSGFNLGQLDLHLASPLSQKISYYGEITLNARPTQYAVELERSFIRYDYNDYFKISFGRFHTPIGYWNTAFHHGAWLQTTMDRPFMVRVGGNFTPVHFVGLLAEGNIPSGGAGLHYQVGLGNGRGEVISRPGDAGDINSNRSWVANVFSRPAKLYGLELGASVYQDKITFPNPNLPANFLNFKEWITSAYVVWTKGSPEFLSEYDHVHHRNVATNQVANSDAYYVQFAYRLPWLERTLKPYYRFEYAHMPLSEQVFVHQDQVQSIVGLRYDISSFAAFKSEYRYTKAQPGSFGLLAQPAVNGLFFQTAFTF
jgi:hypothetical protein